MRIIKQNNQFKLKRLEYDKLNSYLQSSSNNIMILSGIRRTGKTILLNQLAYNNSNNSIIIQCEDNDTVENIIREVMNYNKKYIFIDEVTKIYNINKNINLFYDLLTSKGYKVILTGTDSLSFEKSFKDSLFGRYEVVKIKPLNIIEYERLTGKDIGSYKLDGGLFYSSEEDVLNDITNNIYNSINKNNTLNDLSNLTKDEIKSIIVMFLIRVVWVEEIERLKSFKALGIKNEDIAEINNFLSKVVLNFNPYFEYNTLKDISIIYKYLVEIGIIHENKGIISESKDKKIITPINHMFTINNLVENYCTNNNLFINKGQLKGIEFERFMNSQVILTNNVNEIGHFEKGSMELDDIILKDNKLIMVDYKLTDKLEIAFEHYNNSIKKIIKNIIIDKTNLKVEELVVYKGKTDEYKGIQFKNYKEYLKELNSIESNQLSWI